MSFSRFFSSSPFCSASPLRTRPVIAPLWWTLWGLDSRRRRALGNKGFVIQTLWIHISSIMCKDKNTGYNFHENRILGSAKTKLHTLTLTSWVKDARPFVGTMEISLGYSSGRNLPFNWRSDGLWGKTNKLAEFIIIWNRCKYKKKNYDSVL